MIKSLLLFFSCKYLNNLTDCSILKLSVGRTFRNLQIKLPPENSQKPFTFKTQTKPKRLIPLTMNKSARLP